jgi:hypothetical protein
MISFYRFKRYAFYITLLAVPFLFFIIMFFTIGLKRIYLGEGLYVTVISPVDTLICIIGSMVFGMVIIAIGNKILRHPIITMIEGKGLLSMILDSTGLIGCFNVIVNAPKMMGKKPGENLELDETYDVDIMHRIIFPKDAPLVQGFEINRDEITGKTFLKNKMILVLPDDETKHDTLFQFESRPVFIYNKVMGQFLSRNMLAKNEKHMQLKHSSLNILYKLATLGDVFRDFGRYAGELTRPKPKGLFARWPWLKWVLIGLVILIIVMIIFMFIPGFSKSFGNLQI